MTKEFKTREDIIEKVKKTITIERQDKYGNPENSFDTIGKFWSIYLHKKYGFDIKLSASDVSIMMALLKIAREASKHNSDNQIDGSGYLILGEYLNEE